MDFITLEKDQKLTEEQAKNLFEDITKDKQSFEIETTEPWGIISKCYGLAMRQNFDTGEIIIYGYRTLSKPRQSGYALEGWVSIKGENRSAFTTSHLFELTNGHLIDVGILFVREK